MSIIDSPHIDHLYSQYTLDDFVHDNWMRWLRIEHKDLSWICIIWNYSLLNRIAEIESIEGRWHGHELMILFLLEMYASSIHHITLLARTKDSEMITQENLIKFYKRFGFTGEWNDISWDGIYMKWVEWRSLQIQIKKYCEAIVS